MGATFSVVWAAPSIVVFTAAVESLMADVVAVPLVVVCAPAVEEAAVVTAVVLTGVVMEEPAAVVGPVGVKFAVELIMFLALVVISSGDGGVVAVVADMVLV